jgi:putative spermidine/putrescine transport system ATP-binding protein
MLTCKKTFHVHGGQQVPALDDVSLDVREGTLFTLLGASGSGKTTMLRSIAGLERPDSGRISIGGSVVLDTDAAVVVPANKRKLGMVFQSYAIWPHLSVFDNVAYPLRVRGDKRSSIRADVQAVLAMMHMEHLIDRSATMLSGGQQQRLALARAVVARPRLLLLDEPLSNLDAKLRELMRFELKRLQREMGITTLYVTHDQDEALAMSDRLAVFNHGRIEQVGAPADVYERPATPFVAGFVGTSNLLSGDVAQRLVGSPGLYTVRPEKIRLAEPDTTVADDEIAADGHIRSVVYLGSETRYIVSLDAGTDLVVTEQNLATSSMEALAAQGRAVRLIWKREHVLRVHE